MDVSRDRLHGSKAGAGHLRRCQGADTRPLAQRSTLQMQSQAGAVQQAEGR